MRARREIVIIQHGADALTKPFFGSTRTSKQRAVPLVGNKTRTPAMQFILDLIWNRSRSRFLATIGEPEAQH